MLAFLLSLSFFSFVWFWFDTTTSHIFPLFTLWLEDMANFLISYILFTRQSSLVPYILYVYNIYHDKKNEKEVISYSKSVGIIASKALFYACARWSVIFILFYFVRRFIKWDSFSFMKRWNAIYGLLEVWSYLVALFTRRDNGGHGKKDTLMLYLCDNINLIHANCASGYAWNLYSLKNESANFKIIRFIWLLM